MSGVCNLMGCESQWSEAEVCRACFERLRERLAAVERERDEAQAAYEEADNENASLADELKAVERERDELQRELRSAHAEIDG